jgi:hypothetical protein
MTKCDGSWWRQSIPLGRVQPGRRLCCERGVTKHSPDVRSLQASAGSQGAGCIHTTQGSFIWTCVAANHLCKLRRMNLLNEIASARSTPLKGL